MIIHRRVDGLKTQKCAPKGAFSCTMFHFSIAHPIGIIGEVPGGATGRHAYQLPAMLPGIRPGSVGQGVADAVVSDGLAVVSRQQISPVAVAVGVIDRVLNCAQGAGGVGVLLAAGDVAGIIVGPHPGLSGGLVVLTGQLVLLVVGVGGGLAAEDYGFDVAVGIVVVLVRSHLRHQGSNLSAGGAGGSLVGDGLGEHHNAVVLRHPLAHPAECYLPIMVSVFFLIIISSEEPSSVTPAYK